MTKVDEKQLRDNLMLACKIGRRAESLGNERGWINVAIDMDFVSNNVGIDLTALYDADDEDFTNEILLIEENIIGRSTGNATWKSDSAELKYYKPLVKSSEILLSLKEEKR